MRLTLLFFVLFFVLLSPCHLAQSEHNYLDALHKCILFFEGQRSGLLPPDQRVDWRGNSALQDGSLAGVDLEGGYYDAGDNIKFGFPMAFTTTMLAWGVIEFGHKIPESELPYAIGAIRWATDYFLKCTIHLPNRLYVQVGDPNVDHTCWSRPEDMDTNREVSSVNEENPGSDVAGEIAAALAASSIVFRNVDVQYAEQLFDRANRTFLFADTFRGSYATDRYIRNEVCPFYCSSGPQDEQLWAAAWLYKASKNEYFLEYIDNMAKPFGAFDNPLEFGWDDKHAGLNVLMAREFHLNQRNYLLPFNNVVDHLMCALKQKEGIRFTPGGLIYKDGGSNLQHVTSISFLLLAHANTLIRSNRMVNCGGSQVSAKELQSIAKLQVDYILGTNPMGMSYMVGYGKKYPLRIHHRASSLPSKNVQPLEIPCSVGTKYFNSRSHNPNTLVGAIVGGPGNDDTYIDERVEFRMSEPTTYINAPAVGVLAYFIG